MAYRVTNAELNERVTERARKVESDGRKVYGSLCQKCETNNWEKQICKCPTCVNGNINEPRMFIHINQKSPHTIDWGSYDQETDSYMAGVMDSWTLCRDCSRKYQVYANW